MKRLTGPESLRQAEQALSESDPGMAELINTYGPIDIRPWERDLFTSLISSIVSQQLSTKAAATICGRLMDITADNGILSAEKLLQTGESQLRSCGLSQAKCRYSLTLAQAVASGELDLHHLAQLEDEQVISHLITYPGIGRWTAEMFLIFALGAVDVLATADLGLKRGMQRYCGLPNYPEPEEFFTLAEVWRPHRSIASLYLWRLSDN